MFVLELHRQLNDKIEKIAAAPEFAPRLPPETAPTPASVSSPPAWPVPTPATGSRSWAPGPGRFFPGDHALSPESGFHQNGPTRYEKILVIEETYPVIELQLARPPGPGPHLRAGPPGRGADPRRHPPGAGDLSGVAGRGVPAPPPAAATGPPSAPAAPTGRRSTPSRRPFPGGIFPSDIGCYTLGLNLGAVDTCHCMGAGISQAAGFYRAYAAGGGEFPTIVATIGDSTFFHAGVPALINAVFHQARFILVILDNATTAMTGHQPTPQVGFTATGEAGHPVFIPDLVRASGAGFIKEADPYDLPAFMDLLREADAYCRSPAGGVAVVIAKHPCLLDKEARKSQTAYMMSGHGRLHRLPPLPGRLRVPRPVPGRSRRPGGHRRRPLRRLRRVRPRLPRRSHRGQAEESNFGGRGGGAIGPFPQTPFPNPLRGIGGGLRGRAGDTYEKRPPALTSTRSNFEAANHCQRPGGQGALTLTRLLAEAAAAMGLSVITSETHGMAQRGGTIISMIKAGPFRGPLIPPGKRIADCSCMPRTWWCTGIMSGREGPWW